jgi:molecular chaperone GrpE
MSGSKKEDQSAPASEMKKENETKGAGEGEGQSTDKSAPAEATSAQESQSADLYGVEDESGGEAQKESAKDPGQLIRDLEAENASLKDQLLRKQADFENFRKRVARDKEEMARFSNSMLLLDIIEIIDDFERAIKSSEESKDFAAFHSGIELIEKQFTSMLERKWGLCRFDSQGEVFDPERHQAIATEESSEHDQPTVAEDYQKGYQLHERVLRPAKVKVVQPLANQPTAETDDKQPNNMEASGGDSNA